MSREFQFVPQTSRSLNTRSLGPSAAPFPLDSPLTSSLDPLSSNPSNLAKVDPPRSSARSTRLIWQNVTFTPESVHRRWLTLGLSAKRERRQIISGLTGELACGQLKAIIGPSGVGKSTLLKIITGRRTTHVTGNIFVRNAFVRPLSNETISRNPTPESKRSFGCSNRVLAKIAYIPQNDYHLRGLTVRESLRFAAQLKLYQQTIPLQAFHSSIEAEPDKSGRSELERLVSAMLQVLMLQDCGDTLVPNCSGGQVRRLSIGVELLGFPQLILLDEPTTGLDFVSALQIVRMLRSLTELPYRPGILCTIHQPSCEILQLFTHLYIIGSGGVCIYDGHVSEIEQTIALFDLQCPPYFNLADYLLQCSYGEFGLDLVRQMAKHQTCGKVRHHCLLNTSNR